LKIDFFVPNGPIRSKIESAYKRDSLKLKKSRGCSAFSPKKNPKKITKKSQFASQKSKQITFSAPKMTKHSSSYVKKFQRQKYQYGKIVKI
jgi:hypothetical protein